MRIQETKMEKIKIKDAPCDNPPGKDRRRHEDPTVFGYFALDGYERRRCGSIFAEESPEIKH